MAKAVYCDDAGINICEKLQCRAHAHRAVLQAFDLLDLDGPGSRPQDKGHRRILCNPKLSLAGLSTGSRW